MNQRTDPSTAFAELQARLAADLRPVRPFVPGRWMAFFLALFAPFAGLMLWRVFGWRPDQGDLGGFGVWGLSALELAAALVLLPRVLREAVPGRSSSPTLLALAAAAAMAIHAAVILATFARSQVHPAAGSEWTTGRFCFAVEVALAVPCVLFALWLGRRGLTARPLRLGLLGGLGAGLAADALWRLVCPYSAPAHAFGSHSLGIAAAAGLGLILAAWWQSARTTVWRAAGR